MLVSYVLDIKCLARHCLPNRAKVACRQLGFTNAVGPMHYGRGSGKVWLDDMACTGSESSLPSCSHPDWGNHNCAGHTEDVGVVCSGYKAPSADNIQLEPGATGSGVAGIVRVYHNGQWGTVCHRGWDMNDAKVACRQLGFTKAVGYWYYGRGSGKLWLNNMQCSGSETSLHRCTHNGWGNVYSYCNSHTRDVGVVCSSWHLQCQIPTWH
ncbi:hypothetical protein QZH41_010897 [Actinostola sp. cb2023]|nr:hypothetical protein QZH41_010897 [Actinostola sp. cb2023]